MEKQFGTKGAIFSLDAVSAAEYVKDTQKEAAIYFAIKKTVGAVPKGTDEKVVLAPKIPRETFYSFTARMTVKVCLLIFHLAPFGLIESRSYRYWKSKCRMHSCLQK